MKTNSPTTAIEILNRLADIGRSWVDSELNGTSFYKEALDGIDKETTQALAELESLMMGVIDMGENAIKSWEKHAYSMESMVNDQLVYSKHPNADQRRRENDVTDRRAILLATHVIKEQRTALRAIFKQENK